MDKKSMISNEQIIMLCSRALQLCDDRLIEHGSRVAYIAGQIYENLEDKTSIDLKVLFLLALFHDTGAYKTEEINRMVTFETDTYYEHSIYGYLFFKYLSPLKEYSKALLYHHTPYAKLKQIDYKYKEYASLIHLADRIDIATLSKTSADKMAAMLTPEQFDPAHIAAFKKFIKTGTLPHYMPDDVFKLYLHKIIKNFSITTEEIYQFLKMIIYFIDFKSQVTVLHSLTTTIISEYLATKAGLSEDAVERIRFAALIHDIGKIGISETVLEYPGRLSEVDMTYMKKHVLLTEMLIHDILPPDITNIAVHHHEKLDGSGYPYGLHGKDLSLSERIVAVADILSALTGKRSYKPVYDKGKALSILKGMAADNLIDGQIVLLVEENLDEILTLIRKNSEPVLQIYQDIHQQYQDMVPQDNTQPAP